MNETTSPAPFQMTRADWRIAIVGALAVLVITAVPYLVGYQTASPDLEYGGFTLYADDYNSYLAKMRQGEGSWVYQIPYTVAQLTDKDLQPAEA